MKKRSTFFITAGMLFLSLGIHAQYSEVNSRDLEMIRIHNQQNGRLAEEGIYTNLLFKVEDFAILKGSLNAIHDKLAQSFPLERFELNEETQTLEVVFERSKSTSDDFIALLKEVLSLSNVFLTTYEEKILVKKA